MTKGQSSTNFGFLNRYDATLVAIAARAEQYFPSDPVTCLMKLRQFGELLAQQYAARMGVYSSVEEPQTTLLARFRQDGVVGREALDLFHTLRRVGNDAVHSHTGDHAAAMIGLKAARQLAIFFHRTFGDPAFKPGPFEPPRQPADATLELRAEIERLQAERDAGLSEAESARDAAARAEIARLEAEARADAEASDRAVWETLAADEQAGAALGQADLILSNPPFGTKKGGGRPVRSDFSITADTSNKQLAFVEHIVRALKPGGRAGIVVPDNVLFADGAGRALRECWYSEARDAHSFFDVDHFRPKSEAKRSEEQIDDGYSWLAFDWLNYRYSAQRSNRLSKDEETQATEGKGSWFPLMSGSPTATWHIRTDVALSGNAIVHLPIQPITLVLICGQYPIERLDLWPRAPHVNPAHRRLSPALRGLILAREAHQLHAWHLNREWPPQGNLPIAEPWQGVDNVAAAIQSFLDRLKIAGTIPPPPHEPRLVP